MTRTISRAGSDGHGYRQLWRVMDGPVAHPDARHEAFHVVVGAQEDAWAVEAALALLAFGRVLVGVDWGDVMAVAGGGAGLARVLPRVRGVEGELAALRDDLAGREFGEGFALVQLLRREDETAEDLRELDRLATGLFAGTAARTLFTSVLGAPFARSVLIGFGRGNVA